MFGAWSGSFRAGRRAQTIATPVGITGGFVWLDGAGNTSANFGSVLIAPFTVSTWKDVYGASHDANKGGGASGKPVWASNVQNSLGVVRFDSANSQSLNINPVNSPSPGLQGISGYSLFAVAKLSSTATNRTICASNTGGFKIYHDGTNWAASGAAGTGTSSVAGDTTNFHLYTAIFDGSQTGNADRLKFRYDRVAQTLNFGATTVGATTNATANTFYVGQDSAGNYFNGDIAELILYSRTVTSSELIAVERYLKNRWAI